MYLYLFYGKAYITKSEELASPSHSSFCVQRYEIKIKEKNEKRKILLFMP